MTHYHLSTSCAVDLRQWPEATNEDVQLVCAMDNAPLAPTPTATTNLTLVQNNDTPRTNSVVTQLFNAFIFSIQPPKCENSKHTNKQCLHSTACNS